MSRRKVIKRLYTLIGFDEEGMEIARFEGITEDEAWTKERDYTRVSVFESGVVSPRVECDIPKCERVAVARIKLERSGPILSVCRYHATGVYVVPPIILPVEGRLKYKGIVIAPYWLCIKYCPSYWEKVVAGEIKVGVCRAFKDPESAKERRKRERGYTVCDKRMTVLCIQDEWWAFIAGVSDVTTLEELYV